MGAGLLNKMRIGAIIQARMHSTRLQGKILLPLPFHSSDALLSWPIKEIKKSKLVQHVILATSINAENDVLADFANKQEVHLFSGSEDDVLMRFVEAAALYNLDIIVRLTGDNPVIDAGIVDELITKHTSGGYDYSYSVNLPVGMNIEVITASALNKLPGRPDLTQADKEHVTNFFTRLNLNKILRYQVDTTLNKDVRLTVDFPGDYAMINIVAEISKNKNLHGVELVRYIENNCSWIFDINAHLYQKKQYDSFEAELTDSMAFLQIHEFNQTLHFLKSNLEAGN
jgi:spore coat polysaccharide biosynthesis protein SpsF